MRRARLPAILSVLLLAVLTACGGGESVSDDATETQTEAAGEQTESGGDGGGAESVSLDFGVWTYDLETVEGLLDEFQTYTAEEAEPPINVDVSISEAGYGEYDAHVTSLFSAGTQLDVLYGSDHWLAKWADAGWVEPVEEHCPELTDYEDQITEFSLNALTYNDQLYGLPYYSDVMYFVYNQAMLEEAGISEPPSTWEEVTQQSVTLMEEGVVDEPLLMGLTIDSWFEEELYALLYSRGGQLFDENYNATFATDSGPLYETVEWMRSAIQDEQIMPQDALQLSIQDAALEFQKGNTAFGLVAGYMMRDLNSESSAVADDWRVAMMPGSSGESAGFTRMYLLGSGATENETTRQAACRFIEFHGGQTQHDGEEEYHVAKTWAVNNGLGFSIDALWEDEEINQSFSETADIDVLRQQKEQSRAKGGMQAPWFSEWISFVRPQIQEVLLGQQDTQAALEAIKQQWEQLSAG